MKSGVGEMRQGEGVGSPCRNPAQTKPPAGPHKPPPPPRGPRGAAPLPAQKPHTNKHRAHSRALGVAVGDGHLHEARAVQDGPRRRAAPLVPRNVVQHEALPWVEADAQPPLLPLDLRGWGGLIRRLARANGAPWHAPAAAGAAGRPQLPPTKAHPCEAERARAHQVALSGEARPLWLRDVDGAHVGAPGAPRRCLGVVHVVVDRGRGHPARVKVTGDGWRATGAHGAARAARGGLAAAAKAPRRAAATRLTNMQPHRIAQQHQPPNHENKR